MDRINTTGRAILISLLLGAATLAVYWPLLRSNFISFDDAQYVTENRHVLTGLTWENVQWAMRTGLASNWHPLTWMSHMLDVTMFGQKAGLHHLTNVLFHVANAVLLFLLLRRLTGAEWRSALVAALFALHPLHVESVAWIAERKDVLSTFFFVLTIWAYAEYAKRKEEGSREKEEGRWKSEGRPPSSEAPRRTGNPKAEGRPKSEIRNALVWYSLAIFLFALGLMSKPMLVTLPFVLLLLDLWPLGRLKVGEMSVDSPGKQPRAKLNTEHWKLNTILPLLWEKVPFFCLAAASSVVTFLAQREGHSVSDTEGLPLDARLANAVASYFKYLSKTIWPVDLAIFYPHPGIRGQISDQLPDWAIFLAGALILAISISALVRLKRDPWLATGWFWYLGTLVPVIGVVQVGGQAMADRYTYIPLIGVFICFVWGVAEVLRGRAIEKSAATVAGLAAVAACIAVTQRQVKYWHDDTTVFEHAAAVTKHNAIALYTLGLTLGRQGKINESIEELKLAMEADPTYPESYYTMGVNLAELGKLPEAVENYRTAIRLRPHFWMAHSNLGAMLWRLGQREEALQEYNEALRYNPEYPEAHYNLGAALSALGRTAEAGPHFAEVVRLQPDNIMAITHLAETLVQQGNLSEAEARMREVVRLSPTNAGVHFSLAEMLTLAGKRDEALGEFNQALRLKPDYVQAHFALAGALMERGKYEESAAHFGEAARLAPAYAEAHTGLGRVLAVQGKMPEAQAQFREVLRLTPTNAEAHVTLGNALMVTGQTNEAAAQFAEALRLQPSLFDTTMQAAQAFEAKGQIEQALARYNTALWLKPEDSGAHQNLGLLLARQGKIEDAVTHFQEAIRLRPDAQAYYNLALAQIMQGKPKAAAANYEQALKLKPDWPDALNDLAWLLATHSQADARNGAEAVRLAERACQLEGGQQARFWGTLAAAYAEAGRFDEAAKTADKAISLAETAGQKDLAERNRQLRELYRAGKAFHESTAEAH